MECCNLRYIGKNPIDLRTDEVTTVNQEQKIVVKDVAINGNVKDLVKDRGIFNSKSLTGTDYNTITKQGVYSIPNTGSTNGPGYTAKLLVYSVAESPFVTQVAIDTGSVAIKCRYKSDTVNWTPWETVIFNTDTATTSKAGIVQLNNTVTSTSTTQAATANAVKLAYDKAVEASESTGRSETADKLTTARTIQTNLASTTAGSFDGSKNITIGVSGTLPTANGGTGRTDGKAVALVTARTISLTGVVTGSASFDGSKNISIATKSDGIGGNIPIGGIIAFSGTFGGTNDRFPIPLGSSTPDTNWCLCDGTTTNGKAVPDLRGRMILGANSSHAAGTKGGAETHTHSISGTVGATTLSTAQMPSHTHSTNIKKYDWTSRDEGRGHYVAEGSIEKQSLVVTASAGGNGSHTHPLSGAQSGSASSLPPYYVLAYIMRCE